jgi:hypothetical protein
MVVAMSLKFIASIIHKAKKLTIFDWLILLCISILIGVFVISRYAKREEWVSIKLKISADEWWWTGNTPENNIINGQSSYDSFGKKIATIDTIEKYDLGGSNRLTYVNLKILASFNKKTQTYTFEYQPLEIGKSLDLTFAKYNIHGIVTYIGNNINIYTDKQIEVKLLAVYPWEANSYIEGLQMKDMEGNTVATVESVSVANADISQLQEMSNRIILFPSVNDQRKDVTMRLTIKTYPLNGVLYFIDGAAIKIGESIWFQFEQTAIRNAIITKIF